MMPYIIILKVRKFHQTTASRFSTARKKPVGGAHCAPPPPSLNRVKHVPWKCLISTIESLFGAWLFVNMKVRTIEKIIKNRHFWS